MVWFWVRRPLPQPTQNLGRHSTAHGIDLDKDGSSPAPT